MCAQVVQPLRNHGEGLHTAVDEGKVRLLSLRAVISPRRLLQRESASRAFRCSRPFWPYLLTAAVHTTTSFVHNPFAC